MCSLGLTPDSVRLFTRHARVVRTFRSLDFVGDFGRLAGVRGGGFVLGVGGGGIESCTRDACES